MCFAHVMMNLTKKLRSKNLKDVRQSIQSDVNLLQQSSGPGEFRQGIFIGI